MESGFSKTMALTVFLALAVSALVCAGASQEPSSKQVTLKMSWWGGDDRHKGTIAAIDLWNKMHPETMVEYAYSGYGGYTDKLTTQFAGRVAPDVIQVDRDTVEQFAESGVLLDISKYVSTLFADTDKTLWSWGLVGEKTYAVPAGTTAIGLIYNKTLFAKLGLRSPSDNETWDSLLELLKQATRDIDGDGKIDVWGIDNPYLWGTEKLNEVVHQWGMDVFSDDMVSSNFGDPRMKEVYLMFKRFVDAGAVPPAGQVTPPEGLELLSAGMIAAGIEPLSQFVDMQSVTDSDLECATIPRKTANGPTGTSLNPPMVFCISAYTKYPQQSAEFLSWFLTSIDAAKATGMVRGVFPTAKLREAMQPSMSAEDLEQSRVLKLAAAEGKSYRGRQPKASEEFGSILVVEQEKLAFGQISIDEFLQNVVQRADPVLKE